MKLYTRQEILQINKVFTYHLIQVQDAKHKPKENEYKIGDKVILDDSNKSVTLTQELADKLNEEYIDDYNAKKDSNPFTTEFKWIGRTTMISGKNSDIKFSCRQSQQPILTLKYLPKNFGKPF